MPNPSTVASGDETAYHYHNAAAHNLRLSKADREYHLRHARKYAELLGIEGPGPINGHPAGERHQTSEELNAERDQLLARIDEIDRELEDRAEQRHNSQ